MIDIPKMLVELRRDRPKLLIVDDQPINIRSLHEIFKADCEVFMATHGPQALALAESHQPDLILLDIFMPDMDGHEVCRQLKLNSATKDIPVIFLTAQHTSDDEAIGLQLGAVDFIMKPINSVVVRSRVNIHLALKIQSEYLQNIALKDGLTGIANRRKFDEQLIKDWMQCQRESAELSFVMIDIDYFKNYNDTYGHAMGDTCLRKVAQTIQSAYKRPYDLVARYGGEEFACLLPHTNLESAMRMAEKVKNTIADMKIEHSHSAVSKYLTLSQGVATCIPNCEITPSILIKAADARLYEAKHLGKNQIQSIFVKQAVL